MNTLDAPNCTKRRLPTFTLEDLLSWGLCDRWQTTDAKAVLARLWLLRRPHRWATALDALRLKPSQLNAKWAIYSHDVLWVACHALPADYVPSFKVAKLVGEVGGHDVWFHLTQYESVFARVRTLRDDLEAYVAGDDAVTASLRGRLKAAGYCAGKDVDVPSIPCGHPRPCPRHGMHGVAT